jgi:hypothetical protein
MEVLTHGNGGINIPVNLRRLIWNAQTHYNCGPNKVPPPGELKAVEIVQRVKVRGAGWWWVCTCYWEAALGKTS